MAGTTPRGHTGVGIPFAFARRSGPRVDVVRQHVGTWVRRRGLVDRLRPRRRFATADYGGLAMLAYPDSGTADLCVVADWLAWSHLLGDQLDPVTDTAASPARWHLVGELLAALGADGVPEFWRAGGSAPVDALADLWTRTAPAMSPGWRERAVRHVAEHVVATCAAQHAGHPGAAVDPAAAPGPAYLAFDLVEFVHRGELPAPVHGSGAFGALLDAAAGVLAGPGGPERDPGAGERWARFDDAARDLLDACPGHRRELEPYLGGLRSCVLGLGARSPAAGRSPLPTGSAAAEPAP